MPRISHRGEMNQRTLFKHRAIEVAQGTLLCGVSRSVIGYRQYVIERRDCLAARAGAAGEKTVVC